MLTAYVVVGGLLVAYLSFSVVADVARYHRVLTAMAKANVPESWLTTLAAPKQPVRSDCWSASACH